MEITSPVPIEPERYLKISFTHKSVRRIADSDLYVTQLPAIGMKIEVFVDQGLENLEFQADTAHRKQPDQVKDGPRMKAWEISAPFLPNQGYVLFWAPSRVLES